MSFRFSLQRVLNLREQETQEAELKVEQTKSIINELKKMIHHERDLYFDERDELNKNVASSQLNNVIIYESSLRIRQERIMELLDNIRTYQSDLEVLQQVLIQCKKNKKILENLRDIKQKEFLKKEAAREQALLDDVSNQRYIRAQQNEKGEE